MIHKIKNNGHFTHCGLPIDREELDWVQKWGEVTCVNCLELRRKNKEEKDNKHKIIVVCLHNRPSIVLEHDLTIGIIGEFNVDKIIDMVCKDWSHWASYEITHEDINCINIATVDRVIEL